jgi:hypothetical protein
MKIFQIVKMRMGSESGRFLALWTAADFTNPSSFHPRAKPRRPLNTPKPRFVSLKLPRPSYWQLVEPKLLHRTQYPRVANPPHIV